MQNTSQKPITLHYKNACFTSIPIKTKNRSPNYQIPKKKVKRTIENVFQKNNNVINKNMPVCYNSQNQNETCMPIIVNTRSLSEYKENKNVFKLDEYPEITITKKSKNSITPNVISDEIPHVLKAEKAPSCEIVETINLDEDENYDEIVKVIVAKMDDSVKVTKVEKTSVDNLIKEKVNKIIDVNECLIISDDEEKEEETTSTVPSCNNKVIMETTKSNSSIMIESVNTDNNKNCIKVNTVSNNIENQLKKNVANGTIDLQQKLQKQIRHDEKECSNVSHEQSINDECDLINLINNSHEISDDYKEFLRLCLNLDKSNDMQTLIRKRLIKYYNLVNREYTSSQKFCNLLKCKMVDMNKSPQGLYVHILTVLDELKVRRLKAQSEQNSPVEVIDRAKLKRIKRLDKEIYILDNRIKELEKEETDFSDNSAYIKGDKYKRRLVRCHKILCKLKGEHGIKSRGLAYGVISSLKFDSDKFPGLSQELKKLASVPSWFPDFSDILSCVKKCSRTKLSDSELENEAIDLFNKIGKRIQIQRKRSEYSDLMEILENEDTDPADNDPILAATLKAHKQIHKEKEKEIINKYVRLEALNTKKNISTNENVLNNASESASSSDTNKAISKATLNDSKKPPLENKESNVILDTDDSDVEFIT